MIIHTIIQMTVVEFKKVLPKICGKDTSFDPDGWTRKNMFWGHSAVVSLLAQSLFHGGIFGISLRGTKFWKMKFNFCNVFPDGLSVDFTRAQFRKEYPDMSEAEKVEVYILFANKNTRERFKLLLERFEAECKKV